MITSGHNRHTGSGRALPSARTLRAIGCIIVLAVVGSLRAFAQSGAPHPIPLPSNVSPTSYAFHDAQVIAAELTSTAPNYSVIEAVLNKWGIAKGDIPNNPFLMHLTELSRPLDKTKLTGTQAQSPLVVAAPGPMNYNLPTAVADALGSFIAQRVKEEAEIAFLIGFRNYVVDSKDFGPHVQPLLPRTYDFLKALTKEGIDQPDFLGQFNQVGKSDLADITTNLNPFLDSFQGAGGSIDVGGLLTHAAVTTGVAIIGKKSPYQIVDLPAEEGQYYQNRLTPNAQSLEDGFELLSIASHALALDNKGQWVTTEEIKAAFGADPQDAQYMTYALLGLSYSADKNLYIGIESQVAENDHRLSIYLQTDAHAQALLAFLQKIAILAAQVQTDEKRLANNTVTVSSLEPLTKDIENLFIAISDCGAFSPQVTASATDIKTVVDQIVKLEDLVSAAQNHNYSEVSLDLVALLSIWYPNNKDASAFTDFLKTDGSLIIEVAQAKNATDTKTLVAKYAEPASSYIEKQLWPFTVTLNGYFGAEVGNELLIGNLAGTTAKRSEPRAGFTAPVGIDFNWAMPDDSFLYKHFYVGATSLFIPIVDVGAVATWRLGNSTGTVPSLTWSNIVAPGAFVVFQLRDLPISILIGTQYGPGLRNTNSTSGATIQKAAWQAPAIAVAFDIPIFTLFNHKKHS